MKKLVILVSLLGLVCLVKPGLAEETNSSLPIPPTNEQMRPLPSSQPLGNQFFDQKQLPFGQNMPNQPVPMGIGQNMMDQDQFKSNTSDKFRQTMPGSGVPTGIKQPMMPNGENMMNQTAPNKFNQNGSESPQKQPMMFNTFDQQSNGQDGSEVGDGQEAQQKMQEERAIKNAKQGVAGFERAYKQMKNKVDSATKKGVPVPKEMSEALPQADALIAEVKSATTLEGLQNAMDQLPDVMQTIQENFQVLGQLEQYGKVVKQTTKQLTDLDRQFKSAQKSASKVKGVDISTIVADYQQQYDALKGVLVEADALYKAGQGQEAFDKLQDFFDQFRDVMDIVDKLRGIANLNNYVSGIQRSLKIAKQQVKMLSARKINVVDLNAITTSVDIKFNEIRQLIQAKPLDLDLVMIAIDAMEDLKNQFEDKVKEVSGTVDELPGITQTTVPEVNVGFIGQVKGAMDSIYKSRNTFFAN